MIMMMQISRPKLHYIAILAMRVQEDRSHRLIPANHYGDAEDDAAAADADDDDT